MQPGWPGAEGADIWEAPYIKGGKVFPWPCGCGVCGGGVVKKNLKAPFKGPKGACPSSGA